MPNLIHCHHTGAQKARVAAMRLGESSLVGNRAEAMCLYQAARRMGLRVSQQTERSGDPAIRITLLKGNLP